MANEFRLAQTALFRTLTCLAAEGQMPKLRRPLHVGQVKAKAPEAVDTPIACPFDRLPSE
jgi:hypothetical protein